MIKNLTFTILFFLISNSVISQVFHINTNIDNTDSKTRKKLGELIANLTARNKSLSEINDNLRIARDKHKAHLKAKYTTNRYDKEDSFLASSLNSISLSLATSILGAYANLPYISKTKKDYLNAVTMDKSILLAIQHLDTKKVSASKRQEIYRLRSQIIREFSKFDRDARVQLNLPLLAICIMNYEKFNEIKNKLTAVEIVF